MKKYLIALSVGIGGALLILGLLLCGYALVADPPTPQPSMSGDVCSRIMPDDVGQRVVIWLRYNGDGGYSLDWEKHQVVTTGMASVPVSVE